MNALLSLSMTLPPLLWIVTSAVLFTSFDISMRFWQEQSNSLYFALGIALAVIGLFCLAMSFPHQNIAVASVMCILFNIIIYLIAAYFLFNETISYKEGVGLLLGFAAIYVLEGMK